MIGLEQCVNEYARWKENVDIPYLSKELDDMESNPDEIAEAFYKELTFGTSGIRGIIGPGTNRINHYVVARTTQGLANYLKEHYDSPSVVIAYDSRKLSKDFADLTAEILSGNGIRVWIFSELTPVSVLSYAIEQLNATMGVMITASHNPKIFNGYKVYSSEGYQIVGRVPGDILEEIDKLDYFEDFPRSRDNITVLDDEIAESFINKVIDMMPVRPTEEMLENIRIVYTPLNGAGNRYVKEAFKRLGFKHIIPVPAQDFPDEEFSTCPVPNPEKITAYTEAFTIMDMEKGDVIIATDPDSDRVGTAIIHDGMKYNLSGNQLGILMLDFLLKHKKAEKNSFVMKSIVTTPLADVIAKDHGLKVDNTLTGFKYIGAKIAELKRAGKEDSYYFGFEESNGYLMDPFIRDKDGISSAVLIGIMAAFYKAEGIDFMDRLDQIYKEYGRALDRQKNFVFEGVDGAITMENIMEYFRDVVREEIGGNRIVSKTDYIEGIDDLPPADVIKYVFEDGTAALIRPSGTEPKIKVYMFLSKNGAKIERAIEDIMKSYD